MGAAEIAAFHYKPLCTILFLTCVCIASILKKGKRNTLKAVSWWKIKTDNYSSQPRKHKTQLESLGSDTHYSSLLMILESLNLPRPVSLSVK